MTNIAIYRPTDGLLEDMWAENGKGRGLPTALLRPTYWNVYVIDIISPISGSKNICSESELVSRLNCSGRIIIPPDVI